jgi:ESS family glutamate:Na+ symporter
MYGQILAWGQYAIPLFLTVFLLKPVFGVNDLFAAVVALGFEGGHGTAAGIGSTFEALDYEEGAQLTLCAATIGLLSGVVFGTLAIKWGVSRGHIARKGRKVGESWAQHVAPRGVVRVPSSIRHEFTTNRVICPAR